MMRSNVMAGLEEMSLSLLPYRGARDSVFLWCRDGDFVFLTECRRNKEISDLMRRLVARTPLVVQL